MVKPAEKIDSIKIAQVNGLGVAHSANQSDGSTGGQRPAYNQALDSIMDLAVQLPGLKKIGEELSDSLGEALGDNNDNVKGKPDNKEKK